MTKQHITISRGPLGGSEEVAQAWVERRAFDALFTEKERWREGYEEVLGLLELRLAINECLGVMADLGGLVYDTAIGALADQAQEARARADALAGERHDLANEVMRERAKRMATEAELEAARALLSFILDSKQVDLKMPEQTAWEYERLIHAYDAAVKAGK